LEGSSESSVDDGQQQRNTLHSGSQLLEVPAFYHDYTFHKGQKYGTISWHEAFYGFMDDEVRVGRFPNPGTTRLPTVRP
jgi:DNA-directed RNA polymerase